MTAKWTAGDVPGQHGRLAVTAADHQPRLHTGSAAKPSRRTLPPRAAYALAALVIGLGLFASVTPSPLYRTYSVLWHFSPLTLTLIYATYAFGVLAALLLAGGVSDDVGRRPVLLAALGALMASTVLFMLADSAAWLFIARGLQGLATGAGLSAASAALLDLHPRRDPAGVGLTNATAAAGGIGAGALVSSSLVQLGTAPRVLPYVVLFVLFAVAFAGAYWMPEPVLARGRFRLTAERPSVPAVVRRPFLLAALAVLSSFSIGGLFFSLGPQLAAHLFGSANVIVSDIGIVALAGSAVIAQLLTGRTAPWIGTGAGSIALAAGMVLIVIAAVTDSGAGYLAGSILGGAGFGAAFLGGLRALVAAIPPGHRAGVMSAFYIAAYASLSVPAVLAGLVITHIALSSTFEVFGGVVAGIALIVAFETWRTRPARMRAAAERAAVTTANDIHPGHDHRPPSRSPRSPAMNGTFTATDGAQVTIHTYTAPEEGWMTTSNLIELPTQLILVDTPLLPDSTNEVLTYAKDLGKPTSRVYISHGHPDHFAGAGLVGAPLYALPSVAAAINNGGGAIIRGALALTGHGRIEPGGLPRIGHHVAAGGERIDGARVCFERVAKAESSEQLTIGFPGDGILIVQDLVYNRVHAFLGEQHFDGWLTAIAALEGLPYATILSGHGLPGDRGLYGDARAYLTAARAAVAEADGLNRYLATAFPGTAARLYSRCRTTSFTRAIADA